MRFHGELSEWPKEHDWKSCIRRKRILGSNPRLSARQTRGVLRGAASPLRRGGRVVECGGLENRLPLHGVRGFESLLLRHLVRQTPRTGAFFMSRLQSTGPSVWTERTPVASAGADQCRHSADWSVESTGTSRHSVRGSGPVPTGPSVWTERAAIPSPGADQWCHWG